MEELGDLRAEVTARLRAERNEEAVPVDLDSQDLKHVLIFGSAGVGKTSFVNALTGQSLPTNGGTRGVTLFSKEISSHRDGVDYRIIDTAGLDEADGGRVSSANAVRNLVRLLETSKHGLNLMVMVVPKGRILASTLNNYELFVNKMVGRMVPLLIVVTHCEREVGDMQGWVETNEGEFTSRGILSSRMVATTFMTPDPEFDDVEHMQAKVDASIALSWGAIQSCATPMPVKFATGNAGFLHVLRPMFNVVARLLRKQAMWLVRDSLGDIVEMLTEL